MYTSLYNKLAFRGHDKKRFTKFCPSVYEWKSNNIVASLVVDNFQLFAEIGFGVVGEERIALTTWGIGALKIGKLFLPVDKDDCAWTTRQELQDNIQFGVIAIVDGKEIKLNYQGKAN